MTREEIIERLRNLSEQSVYMAGKEPYCMSLDDGIALKEAVQALKQEPCEDAVSRDTVRDAFRKLSCNRPLDSDRYVISECEKAVMDLPSVTSDHSVGLNKMVCEDAISREEAAEKIEEYFQRIDQIKTRGLTNAEKAISHDMQGVLSELPSVTPKQKTGKWISVMEGGIHKLQCDQCKINQMLPSRYCPACGSYNGGTVLATNLQQSCNIEGGKG